jgi:hypothetical protein
MKVLGERSENGHHAGCPLFGRTCTYIESTELNPLPARNVTELFFSVAKLSLSLSHPHTHTHTHTELFGKQNTHLILLHFSLSAIPLGNN